MLRRYRTSQFLRKSTLNIHWKDWCWSWKSNTWATWCKEPTQWRRPWCWERLKAGEGDDRGWDGWMASPTQWAWVWVNSRSCWWTGRPGVLPSMGSQRVGHDWVTELNWTEIFTELLIESLAVNNGSLLYQDWTPWFCYSISLCSCEHSVSPEWEKKGGIMLI